MNDHGKLEPKFKADWVAHLRSGEYSRCGCRLIDDSGSVCALGVAAKLMENRGIVRIEPRDGDSCMDVIDTETGQGDIEIIPQDAADKVGLTGLAQTVISGASDETRPKLMGEKNDDVFAEIADWIEKNL